MDSNPYLELNKGAYAKMDSIYMIFTMCGSWILIFCNFVPISLTVTMEMVKFFQGSFLDWDVDMYDFDQNFAARAQSTNIMEEAGQVEYIFSDKTGTLTCNIMEFKKFSSKDASFCVCHEDQPFEPKPLPTDPADFVQNPLGLEHRTDEDLKTILSQTRHAEHAGVRDVLLHLAVCHTVVIDKQKGVYNAASPDELALVDGAKAQGFEFVGREPDNVLVIRDS